MSKKSEKKEYTKSRKGHYALAIGANLLSGGALLIGQVLIGPLVAGICAIAAWFIVWLVIENIVRPRWDNVRNVWYYFPLTLPFCWHKEARVKIERLEVIAHRLEQSGGTETRIIRGVIDPERRTETLREVPSHIRNMADQARARVLDEIRLRMPIIAKPGIVDYHHLLQIIGTTVQFEPLRALCTWDSFINIFRDVFDPGLSYDSQVRKDIITPFTDIIPKVGDRHRPALVAVIEDIMNYDITGHDIACQVLRTILQEGCAREIQQRIFDESVKRASRFPRDFGYELLYTLRQLEYGAFWLDIYSLRALWGPPENYGEGGIIQLNREIYKELCRTVFSHREDPGYEGIRHGRVFRRIKGDNGKVHVECLLPGGQLCNCDGRGLSLRGLFSQCCPTKPHESIVSLRARPIVAPDSCFHLKAKVAEFHVDKQGKPTPGRGILFDDAEHSAVKSLYDYIANIA